MAIKDCIDEIRKIAGDELTEQDIHDIAEEVQRRADAKKRIDATLSDADALDQAAIEAGRDALTAAQIEVRNRALNIVMRQRLDEFLSQAMDAGLRPDQAVSALNVGTNRKVQGGRHSVDARQKALKAEFIGGMVADLEREGLTEFLTRRLGLFGQDGGVMDRDISRALWSIGKDGRATADVSREARRIGEIIAKHQEALRLRMNRAGAFVRKMEGYIVRQSHDMTRIRDAGMKAWIDFIRPLLDERTFAGAEPEPFLRATYYALSSGEHIKSQGATTDIAFKGPRNLAKSVSQERVLHFKNADAWFDYNEKFGSRSLIEAVIGGFSRGAEDIGLMETWGTNPEAMFTATLDKLAHETRDRPALRDKIRSATLKHQFAEITGETRMDGNVTIGDARLSSIGSGVRAVESMAKLGAATVSSITDIATAASELRWQGQNLGSAYTGILAEAVAGRSNAEARAMAAEIGVGIDGIIGDIQSRFTSQDTLPGTASKLMRLFFKLNLLTFWTDSVKTGAGRMMAWRAAQQTGRSWSRVDPRFREALSLYGFDEARWAVIRKAKAVDNQGRAYLTPQAVRDLPDEAFAALGGTTPRRAQSLRDDLSTALQTFYTDRTDVAVVTPGAREGAMLHLGTQRGTWEGEAVRFVAQFKSFPIAFATKVLGRELNGYGLVEGLLKGKGDLLGLAHLIASTTVLGMISMQAKEILKGRSPRDPFGPNWASAWAAAFTQGGGLGIYGDFLFGQANRFGGSLLDTLAGPTLGSISDLKDIWDRVRTGDDPSAQAIRFAAGNTPFANLPYTRIALDYLILYQLQEMASPGYLKRMEKRVKRENDQTFIVPPSEVVR